MTTRTLCIVFALAACSGNDGGVPDAALPDARVRDAAAPDAARLDAATADARLPPPDAALPDAALLPPDAAPPDAALPPPDAALPDAALPPPDAALPDAALPRPDAALPDAALPRPDAALPGCGPVVSLSTEVQPIFTAKCAVAGCHDGTVQLAVLTPDRAYGDLVDVFAVQCSNPARKLVAPGVPESSYLMDKLLGTNICFGSQMPRFRPALSTAELDLIRGWICHGAPNN